MDTVNLLDSRTGDDLRVYLQRLLRSGEAEARLVSRRDVLAVYGCIVRPAAIEDPAVLVMRGFPLAGPVEPPIDSTVQARAVTDRLARQDEELQLPPFEVMVPWAGVLPPVAGWRTEGSIDAGSLAEVVRQGVARIAEALPEQPGEAVVQKLRREVWGAEIAPGIPAGAAFAADAMGFLGGEPLRLARSRAWTRLSATHGHVLVRA